MSNCFTPNGLKVHGYYENERNQKNATLYKAIICEAFDVKDVICGHHIIYLIEETRADGFVYQVIEEVPSADALIFDHDVARRIWGEGYRDYLVKLALVPIEERDALLAELYYGRPKQS